jgi:hypothetical protein
VRTTDTRVGAVLEINQTRRYPVAPNSRVSDLRRHATISIWSLAIASALLPTGGFVEIDLAEAIEMRAPII